MRQRSACSSSTPTCPSRRSAAVQPFLRKCFDALVKLEFGAGSKSNDITFMISPKGEKVPMPRNLKARGPVEDWLGDVENAMKKSLRKEIKDGVLAYEEKERTTWVNAIRTNGERAARGPPRSRPCSRG